MEQKDFINLINRYLEGKCTEEERIKIESAYLSQRNEEFPKLSPEEIENDLQTISDSILKKGAKTKSLNQWKKWSIAACLLLTLGIGVFHFQNKRSNILSSLQDHKSLHEQEILPGSDKAILTLSDGKEINITDLENGEVDLQDGEEFQKIGDGELTYLGKKQQEEKTISYNTLRTPRGGQYRIVLPDGTKVWLNAESSITFPTVFAENERRVEIAGELYFEVTKNKKKPFKIRLNEMEIEVLGTSFNVSAYQDRKEISTTLFEGAVNINMDADEINLKPGRKAVYNKANGQIKDALADLDAAAGWKNGNFIFNNQNIKNIMTDLARWYDVDVEYSGDTSNSSFSAKISRRSSISEVLEILQTTGTINFKIEGRRVTVMV